MPADLTDVFAMTGISDVEVFVPEGDLHAAKLSAVPSSRAERAFMKGLRQIKVIP